MGSIAVLLIQIAVCGLVNALPVWHQGQIRHGTERNKELDTRFSHFKSTRLDHFDRGNTDTFKQRYFLNTSFWNGLDNSPVFLCVGGEGPPLSWTVLVASDHCNDMTELAPRVGALMVALEHRYYGPSNPFDDLATDHLKWLNTEQALADIASFHSFISKEFNLKETNRWIAFGGSYPGMVAALSRYRYPHLIYAAVSSSAPLAAVVDMVGYNNVVAESINSRDVGGSPACLSTVKEGHKEIGDLLLTAQGRRSLETKFNICKGNSLEDEKNQEQFAGDGVVYLPVQSNDPACSTPYCNIASICDLLTNASFGEPIDRLAYLSDIQHGGTCVAVSYDAMIASMKSPSNPERSWIYQTCNEWGFYQTCEIGTECPYTQGLHTLNVDYNICAAAFNISKTEVNYNVEYGHATYGGANIQGSRIFFPNGQIDPWRANGIIVAPNDEEGVMMVQGASHHFWTHPSLPTDSVYVNEVRKVIWDTVTKWVTEE